ELRAVPAHERRPEPVVRAALARNVEAGRGRAGGRGRAHARAGGPAVAAASAAVGRPAPARGAGPGAGAPAAGVPARRAVVEPGREAARRDAGRDRAPAP